MTKIRLYGGFFFVAYQLLNSVLFYLNEIKIDLIAFICHTSILIYFIQPINYICLTFNVNLTYKKYVTS